MAAGNRERVVSVENTVRKKCAQGGKQKDLSIQSCDQVRHI